MFIVIYPISLMIFVRLFIIMGISWVFEGISFLISPDNDTQFFTIFDIWNCLQGPVIFLSFIIRRRVLLLIAKRSVDVGVFVVHIIHLIHINLHTWYSNYHIRVLFDCNFRYQELYGKASLQNDIICDNSCVKLNDFNSNLFDDNSNVLSSNINNSLKF